MECNKDEALRATQIAEEKLAKNDFELARKFALKAKQLFPELANLSQLLTVCDIHCAAQKKINKTEKDLYGILQVEKVADETTIRKQYRKLALLLHPDKNKYLGAEAAFKLIGEANMILSDKSKRSVYDIKYGKTSATKIQNSQGNHTSYAGQQNKSNGVPSSQFGGVNYGQKSAPNPGILLTFWTHCPFCNIKYEYYREFVNRPLRCQHCSKIYIAYDIGPQGPSGRSYVNGKAPVVNLGSKSASQQKKAEEAEKVKSNIQKDGRFTSNYAHKKTEDTRRKEEGVSKPKVSSVQKPMETGTAKGTKRKRASKLAAECREIDSDVEVAGGGVGAGANGVQKPLETGPAKGMNRKRGRKMAAESSEGSGKKEVAGGGVSGDAGVNAVQKPMESGVAKGTDKKKGRKMAAESSDKREMQGGEASDGASANTVQKPLESGAAKGTNKKKERKMAAASFDKKDVAGGGVSAGAGGDSQRRSYRQRQHVSYREDDGGGEFCPQKQSKLNNKSSDDVEGMKKEDISVCEDKPADVSTPNSKEKVNEEDETGDHSESDSEPELVVCPEQEFTNFDKDKEEHCFAVGQIWACYDTTDAMPRFYAQIRKIYSSKFRLRITWFESKPNNEAELKWAEEELPVACGRFVFGDSMETSDRLMFSHRTVVRKDAAAYFIGPQKGEIWAVYKDWDIKWSLDPENHRKQHKFDIVEIVQVHNDYISVAYLLKVKGFISVFQRAGVSEHKIPCNERFRFSHGIPSAKLSGSERAGVPAGSFELDLASLPADFEDYCHYYVNHSCEEKVKPEPTTPKKKHMDCAAKDMLTPRRSPRGLKSTLNREN